MSKGPLGGRSGRRDIKAGLSSTLGSSATETGEAVAKVSSMILMSSAASSKSKLGGRWEGPAKMADLPRGLGQLISARGGAALTNLVTDCIGAVAVAVAVATGEAGDVTASEGIASSASEISSSSSIISFSESAGGCTAGEETDAAVEAAAETGASAGASAGTAGTNAAINSS